MTPHKSRSGRPTLSKEEQTARWAFARDMWMAGANTLDIGAEIGVSRVSVENHARKQGWPKRQRHSVWIIEENTT